MGSPVPLVIAAVLRLGAGSEAPAASAVAFLAAPAAEASYRTRSQQDPDTVALEVSRLDTIRPPIPPHPGYRQWDSAAMVQSAPGQSVFFRRNALVFFHDTATAADVQNFLLTHGASIIGGLHDAYVVEFPDPGNDWAAFVNTFEALSASPGVRLIDLLADGVEVITDGGGPRIPAAQRDTVSSTPWRPLDRFY